MKKLIMLLVVGVIVAGAMQVWAGGSCCASKKKAGDSASCVDKMAKLNLTDEQKAKIGELEAACKAAADDKEACAKYKGQIRDVLTEEQAAQWDEMCGAKSHSGCGDKKTES